MTRTWRLIAAGAIALALGACSSDAAETTDEATTPAEGASTPSDDTAGTPDAASGAEVRDLGAQQVLAEASYTLPGTDDEVTVGVLPLEVDGEVMTLRLAFTPSFASVSDDEPVSVYDMYPDNTMKFWPVLIDRENLKEYSLISETGQDWSSRESMLSAVNGETTYWWGVYAAPEDDVETFDLRLRESLPEFTGIAVP